MLELLPYRRRRLQLRLVQASVEPTVSTAATALKAVIEDPRRRTNLVLGIVVAMTSVAMAVTAMMQWLTMEIQTKQNETIIDQMRAEQEIMKQQVAQTDAVIQQMRLEQRAWLGVMQPEIRGDLKAGEPIVYILPVKNSGRTPGTIEFTNVFPMTRPVGEDIGPSFQKLTPSGQIMNQQTSIAPDATHRFEGKSEQKLGADVLAALTGTSPTRVLYLIGIMRYKGTTGEERLTQFCFVYNPISKGLIAHEKYNFMD